MSLKEIELKPTVFSVKVEGESYEVRKPKATTLSQFQVKLANFDSKKDDSKAIDLIIDFLDSLGLPKEVASELDIDQIETLMEHIGSKKK